MLLFILHLAASYLTNVLFASDNQAKSLIGMTSRIFLSIFFILYMIRKHSGQLPPGLELSLFSDAAVKNTTSATPTQSPSTKPPRQPLIRPPCSCGKGECGCCTGNNILPLRACTNVTYNPEDFLFNIKMYYNERLIYKTSVSGKDPRPICVPIRLVNVKFCTRLSNVYMVGRNVHACLNLDGYWGSQELYHVDFYCFRIGSNGVAVVRPEDGGGLPPPPEEAPLKPGEEDYDDTARYSSQWIDTNNS